MGAEGRAPVLLFWHYTRPLHEGMGLRARQRQKSFSNERQRLFRT